jgi:hypothetical protein
MDHHSTLERGSAVAAEGNIVSTGTGTGRPASVSAGIAAANAHLPKPSETEPRFPGEDGGRSLAEVAHRDLEAALQLLAERAQYITGASGAAIALRRGEHNDMLCRASAGSNAPELGALLSMEYGLSGESVRTRQALRCDDAERDPRVNREGCREMGIASVVVIPIVSEQQVLGVFELFSSKPHAFEERDLLALQRLSEMVETAVKHAVAAQAVSAVEESAGAERELPGDIGASEVSSVESAENAIGADPSSSTVESEKDSPPLEPEKKVVQKPDLEKAGSEQALKPLFWTAATQTPTSTSRPDDITESISVPAELRDLQRCKACGFPISRGRTLCLECEEKQLRGEQLPQPIVRTASVGAGEQPPQQHSLEEAAVIALAGDAPEISVLQNSSSLEDSSPVEASAAQASSTQASSFQTSRAATSSDESSASTTKPATVEPAIAAPVVEDLSQGVSENVPENDASSDISTLFLSSAAPSESWLAANKYVLGALLAVAIVIGLIVWLR